MRFPGVVLALTGEDLEPGFGDEGVDEAGDEGQVVGAESLRVTTCRIRGGRTGSPTSSTSFPTSSGASARDACRTWTFPPSRPPCGTWRRHCHAVRTPPAGRCGDAGLRGTPDGHGIQPRY